MIFTWKRYGYGYEVSTAGDSRFSALNATLKNGRTIEQHYQCDVKGYEPGGTNWKLGKGKPPLNDISRDRLWESYLALWQMWCRENPQLFQGLRRCAMRKGHTLTDRFATSEVNQARALAKILNDNQSGKFSI
jgi:hypothetical protein